MICETCGVPIYRAPVTSEETYWHNVDYAELMRVTRAIAACR